MKRRNLLKGAALGGMSLAGGCCLVKPARCEELLKLPQGGALHQPLVIDTHAHIFNATDLQIKQYFTRVALNESSNSALRRIAGLFAGIVERIAWEVAPSAAKEIGVLSLCPTDESEAALTTVESTAGGSADVFAQRRDEMFQIARRELKRVAALTRAEAGVQRSESQQVAMEALEQFPDSYDALYAESFQTEAALTQDSLDIRNAFRFFVEMFQYRHVSTLNYFQRYNTPNLSIDLLTPSLVDFDWWLAGGEPTPSSISEQIRVNGLISRVSGGRVHAFVCFDPLRQIMWEEQGGRGQSPLDMTIQALSEQGAIGVKTYPPMGFAMYGNQSFADSHEQIWGANDWLPDVARNAGFPRRLDVALEQLYLCCSEHGVPVLAHSSRTNMASLNYEPLLVAKSWHDAYQVDRRLRASFGHFSGLGSGKDSEHWSDFIRVLREDTSNPGQKLRYADVSYFKNFAQNPDQIIQRLKAVLFDPDGLTTGAGKQLLYGSDWKMLLMENASERYLAAIAAILGQAEQKFAVDPSVRSSDGSLTEDVLGCNAAQFLGLRRGAANRARLQNFYDTWSIDTPLWMQKVDATNTCAGFART